MGNPYAAIGTTEFEIDYCVNPLPCEHADFIFRVANFSDGYSFYSDAYNCGTSYSPFPYVINATSIRLVPIEWYDSTQVLGINTPSMRATVEFCVSDS